MAMKPNSKKVIEYLQAHANENLTAADVAAALDIPKKSVDGAFTMSVCRKELGERVAAEVELEDGSHANVKFLKLNDAGMALDLSDVEVSE